MKREDARAMARELMDHHGLREWSLRFDRARRRAGACVHTRREIRLSGPLVDLYDAETVRGVILHEIAHALVGASHHHDAIWQAKARQLGAPDSARHTYPRLGHHGWGYAQCAEHGGNCIRLPDGSPLAVCVHTLLMPRESLSGPIKDNLVNPADSMRANYAV